VGGEHKQWRIISMIAKVQKSWGGTTTNVNIRTHVR
jgi:hypothetical protein